METKVFKVNGMKCDHCRMRVENAIKGVEGVNNVNVDLATSKATVTGTFNSEKVAEAIIGAGYTIEL